METNLWHEISNQCLDSALQILQKRPVTDSETADQVKRLVDIALAVDTQDLRWEEHKLSHASKPITLGVPAQSTGNTAADRKALANTIKDMFKEQKERDSH